MKYSLKLAKLDSVPEDSTVYVEGGNIRKILFTLDAGVPELLLAKQLGFDAVVAHHPVGGTAAINFHEVFRRHIRQMVDAGIPEGEAEKAVEKKISGLEVDAHARNYAQAIDAAKLLRIAFMNVHTPLDEIGRRIMSSQLARDLRDDSTLSDVVHSLEDLPEFANSVTKIKIRIGRREDRAGRVVVSHGAGTNGGYDVARTYFLHGVRTVVYIHIGLSDLEKLKNESRGNLIITGHIASDSVGINPFLEGLEKKGITVKSIGVIRRKGQIVA